MTHNELRERILAADDSLTVGDVVDPDLLEVVPEAIAQAFADLVIAWGPDRAWGEEPILGKDTSITLGHRRGHHIAAHPEWVGYSTEDAAEILRTEIEGTLLHELGHAIWRIAVEADKGLAAQLREAIEADGPVTDYLGHGNAKRDAAQEQWAEAFRWWVSAGAWTNGDEFAAHFGAWSDLVEAALDAAESWEA